MHNLSKAQIWWLILSGHIEHRAKSFSVFARLVLKEDYFIINAHQIEAFDVTLLNKNSEVLIVFWDGLSDYLTNQKVIDDLIGRFNCRLVYVGSFTPELTAKNMYSDDPLMLIYNRDSFFLRFPNAWFYFNCRHGFMVVKNLLTMPIVSLKYYFGGKRYLAFCGVITPNQRWLLEKSEMLGIDVRQLEQYFLEICDTDNCDSDLVIYGVLKEFSSLFPHLNDEDEDDAAVFFLISETLNLLFRTGFVSMLRRDNLPLIAVDFYRGNSLNIYHSFLGRNNYHLDFGSKVGVSGIYPRSADLAVFQKNTINCRYDLSNLVDHEHFETHMTSMRDKVREVL